MNNIMKDSDFPYPLIRKNTRNGSQTVNFRKSGDVVYMTFPLFDGLDWLKCGMSTRLGGVSFGDVGSMNLGFTREEDRQNVLENFRRITEAIGVDAKNCVLSDQTHTDNIRIVTEEDRGKGIYTAKEYRNVDGLATDVKDLVLVTFYADCVPLLVVDPVRHVIASCHSGWKGTVSQIGKRCVELLNERWGSRPEDLLCVIAPSICQDCYEVSDDVIEQFKAVYPEEIRDRLWTANERGRWQLNLHECCRENFLQAGVRDEHIQITDICTCCNSELLFSHRGSGGKRGNLAAFISIVSQTHIGQNVSH